MFKNVYLKVEKQRSEVMKLIYVVGSCFSSDFSDCSLAKTASCFAASFCHLILVCPVPAGMRRPTITFSFNPFSLSTLPLIAASVRTLVVSWNDAAEINELVCSDALVIPNKILSAMAGFFPSFFKFSFIMSKSILSIVSPSKYLSHPVF